MFQVGGGLQNSLFPEETKHQVILPHCHSVVEKIIQATHAKSMYVGSKTTLAILREKIWLSQERRDIKRVLRKCLVCWHQATTPCTQKMAPLPQERVQFTHAFSVIGVDFAGPLYARTKKESSKVYICLFICASSQMLHLELTNISQTVLLICLVFFYPLLGIVEFLVLFYNLECRMLEP